MFRWSGKEERTRGSISLMKKMKNCWLAMARQVRVLAAPPVHRLTNDPPALLIQKFVRRISVVSNFGQWFLIEYHFRSDSAKISLFSKTQIDIVNLFSQELGRNSSFIMDPTHSFMLIKNVFSEDPRDKKWLKYGTESYRDCGDRWTFFSLSIITFLL